MKYVIEDARISAQVSYAEKLIERELSESERHIFEWAYIQGREDAREESK